MSPILLLARRHARALAALITAIAACLIAACEGTGGNVAGVGSGGSGIASGTVSGFGSIIVDGAEYDDSDASRQMTDADGKAQNAAVKLGQRVRVAYDETGKARSIEVLPQLIGPVTAAPDANGLFTVMGQRVRVVASSNDASRSHPTVLDGHATATDIQPGDEVEVHGAWAWDAALAAHVLVASRIERLAVPADPVLLGGVLVALENGLRLNADAGTLIGAPPGGLAPGAALRAWVNRADYQSGASPLPARRLATDGLGAETADNMSLSGLAVRYDPVTHLVEVQGVRVSVANITDTQALDALARGEFVTLKLGRSADGLDAHTVQTRTAEALNPPFWLKGMTSGVAWGQPVVEFSLRGTRVRAEARVIEPACKAPGHGPGGGNPGATIYVEVAAGLEAPGATLTAHEVRCPPPPEPGMVPASFTGSLTAIDPAARRLTLLPDGAGSAVNAAWGEMTYFGAPPHTLTAGRRLALEGMLAPDGLRLHRVEPAD